MIEGHRYAEPILRAQCHCRPREVTVIENIAMGQRRALGVTRSAAGKLDINGIIG